LEKEKWVGAALFMIGLIYLINAITAFWALAIISSALSAMPPEYRSYNPFGGILLLAWVFALLSFFTGIISMIAGILFASSAPKKILTEPSAISEPRAKELYDKLQGVFISAHGETGRLRLEGAIEEYIKKGFTREAAILKVAQDEGYA